MLAHPVAIGHEQACEPSPSPWTAMSSARFPRSVTDRARNGLSQHACTADTSVPIDRGRGIGAAPEQSFCTAITPTAGRISQVWFKDFGLELPGWACCLLAPLPRSGRPAHAQVRGVRDVGRHLMEFSCHAVVPRRYPRSWEGTWMSLPVSHLRRRQRS